MLNPIDYLTYPALHMTVAADSMGIGSVKKRVI